VFASKYLSFSGDNSYLFSSLDVVLNSLFTISVWISTTKNRHSASIVSLGRSPSSSKGSKESLGRSPSSNTGGEFVLEINKDGNLHFWDYSPTTGSGFSVLGGKLINYAGDSVFDSDSGSDSVSIMK